MKDLKILDLYGSTDEDKVNDFYKSVDSSLEVKHQFNELDYDTEWLSMMEEGIRYLDNILRNPNRFIINEEEVVKIELARKITVESIKHLCKNTNFIQEIDDETGDVKPSKILNINKEESYDTYENRFIYSLIRNMVMFINMRKQKLNANFAGKNEKQMQYNGKTKLGDEFVDISINFKSEVRGQEGKNPLENIIERITKLENQITDLMQSELYKTLSKGNISMVMSPIKKTNVILKNTNFQYAVKLWNYLQTNVEDKSKTKSGDNSIKDDPKLKELIDETFMMNYLVADSLDGKPKDPKKVKAASEFMVNNLVQKIIATNSTITQEQLSKMVEDKFLFIKNKELSSSNEIKKIFKVAIDEYTEETSKKKIKGEKVEDDEIIEIIG